MVKPITIAALAALTAFAAAPPVRTMYNDALSREQTVRTTLAKDDAGPEVLTDLRAVIARYEAVVRRYPTSSYCDNALWQGARLAAEAFAKFGQTEDKDRATRLFRWLASAYPTSKLAAQAPDQLARLSDGPPPLPRVVEPPRPTIRESEPLPPQAASPSAPMAGSSSAPPAARAADQQQARLTVIKDIRRSVLADAVRIVIELDGEVEFRQDRLSSPSRVFLDLSATRAAAPLVDRTLRFEGDADLVRQVRVGRHPNNTTRVVLDAAGISSYSIYPMYGPYRLVIDCVRAETPLPTTGVAVASAKEFPAPKPEVPARRNPPLLASRSSTSVWLRLVPGNVPQHGLLLAGARAVDLNPPASSLPSNPALAPAAETATASVLPPAPAAAAAKPADGVGASAGNTAPGAPGPRSSPGGPAVRSNGTGNVSIARQLGLGVSRIVIDAGHGGHDPGAQSRGVIEAELVLDVALRLEKLLQGVPGVEVILTRRTDEFIALQERTAMANREGADLFLSIHANASPNAQARGIETYFLNFASNLSAASVAARENAASGQAMSELPDIVKAIALNNKLDESRDFAAEVQREMLEHLRTSNKLIKDLGVKQAPFVVLIGAAMPSVLAEISFVTNPQEAKLLKSNAYRQRIAEALLTAIRKYQTSLKSVTTVASPQQLR